LNVAWKYEFVFKQGCKRGKKKSALETVLIVALHPESMLTSAKLDLGDRVRER